MVFRNAAEEMSPTPHVGPPDSPFSPAFWYWCMSDLEGPSLLKVSRDKASCVAGPDPEYPENLESGPEVRQVGHTPTRGQVLVLVQKASG